MSKAAIEVQCPCCRSSLKIDVETETVLVHREAVKPRTIDDMGEAVRNLKSEAARREEIFQKSFADQKTRQSVLDKKFDELLKQAKSEPAGERPKRDFDLD